ncbi:hypothetical protein scyTo_0019976 [Scyliorhinus torazame]|uniref:Uncharacterized protein n=1 Tax=Scyliorhinus torazame TaxID=75743 RepID=A0A401PW22_SCYTO|nr:hypothetical protein [Scyliorhinus torazame]
MTGMVAVREERNCFFEAVRDLLNLKTMVGYESDIKLYCPDLDNIKICWKENLQCFNAELNVLTVEFDGGSKQKVTQLIAKLKERFDVHLSYISVHWMESATLMGIVLHVMALEKSL